MWLKVRSRKVGVPQGQEQGNKRWEKKIKNNKSYVTDRCVPEK